MRSLRSVRVAVLMTLAVACVAAGANRTALAQQDPGNSWATWRGPRGDGTSPQAVLTQWSPTKNVLWKAAVPGIGYSTPVICGNRVFLTTAEPRALEQRILAYDRLSGKLLWNTL